MPNSRHRRADFLPTTAADVAARGWDRCDFILVTGDAYVDHPGFANGVLGRVLEAAGYRVGVLSQPDYRRPESIAALGEPRLAFLVSAGNLDSLLNAYTANKLPRSEDPYSPGGQVGRRPPRATLVYCNLIRRHFGKVAIVIGGVEASQRRFSHYDYWEDRVRRSVLLDSNADLLVFGMGEQQLLDVAERLDRGESIRELRDIPGTAFVVRDGAFLHASAFVERFGEPVEVLRHEELLPPPGEPPQRVQEREFATGEIADYRRAYARAFKTIHEQQDPVRGRPLVQRCGELSVVQLPPAPLQSAEQLDRWYDLPYTRVPHPDYEAAGGVPAWKTTQHSIVTHRGCAATCSFCAIAMHQGRTVQSRSLTSIVGEAERIVAMPSFKGTITDVGGPSANMYAQHCQVQWTRGTCRERDCLLPSPCPALEQNLARQVEMLQRVRSVRGVKHAFIASGIRYDLLLDDKTAGAAGRAYIDNLAAHHVSGHLKVAPEHRDAQTLAAMRKPGYASFVDFGARFVAASRAAGKEQYLVAYFVSSHPGCTMAAQIELAQHFKAKRWSPEQVQDFIPTPMTMATAMYYSGFDPESMQPIYTATTLRDKGRQRALLQPNNPELQGRARRALEASGRADLIGSGKDALVPARRHADQRRGGGRARTTGNRRGPRRGRRR